MSLGHRRDTPKPFAYRVLSPLLAAQISKTSGLSVDVSFEIVAVLASWLLCFFILLLLQQFSLTVLWILPIVLLPVWSRMLGDFYFPDILHGALLALFLYLLATERPLAAAPVLTLMFAARESTVMVAVLAVGLALLQRRKTQVNYLLPLSVAALAGVMLNRLIGLGGGPNIHGMNDLVYMAGKAPWNFSMNILGIRLWSNTAQFCPAIWKTSLPAILPLGNLNELGVCSFSFRAPVRTAIICLTTFGIAPLLAWMCLYRATLHQTTLREVWNSYPLTQQFCLLYGLISYALAPLLGASVDRLTAYSWPFYFLTVPWLAQGEIRLDKPAIFLLTAIHIGLSWLGRSAGYEAVTLFIIGLSYVCSYFLLRKGMPATAYTVEMAGRLPIHPHLN